MCGPELLMPLAGRGRRGATRESDVLSAFRRPTRSLLKGADRPADCQAEVSCHFVHATWLPAAVWLA